MMTESNITNRNQSMPGKAPIGIVIMGDCRFLCEAVGEMLSGVNETNILALMHETDDPAMAGQHSPVDVVLISASSGSANSIRAIHKIRKGNTHAKVILVGLDDNEADNLRFIEAGASGYVSMKESSSELLNMIKLSHCQETVCSPRMAAVIFARVAELSRERDNQDAMPRRLTHREGEILRMISQGMRNKEIAALLDITPCTVKNHVHSILDKFQAKNRREAIVIAFESGAITRDHRDSGVYQ